MYTYMYMYVYTHTHIETQSTCMYTYIHVYILISFTCTCNDGYHTVPEAAECPGDEVYVGEASTRPGQECLDIDECSPAMDPDRKLCNYFTYVDAVPPFIPFSRFVQVSACAGSELMWLLLLLVVWRYLPSLYVCMCVCWHVLLRHLARRRCMSDLMFWVLVLSYA